MNPVLFAGAVLGLLSVVIGASADHVLQARVDPEALGWVMTALRYHQIGALVVTALGLVLIQPPADRLAGLLNIAAILFIAGTVLFSFSLYLAAFTGIKFLTGFTPVGGVVLMAAWVVLAWAGVRGRRRFQSNRPGQ